MKIALVTTTINVPRVLELYRAVAGPEVAFFVAIDKKTPEEAVNFVQHDIYNAHVLYFKDQDKWKCSELIGWNCIQRRNIAYLEALKWGADVIVTIDDDNIPLGNCFWDFAGAFNMPFNGIKVQSKTDWFDPGQLLAPATRHRGFPHDISPEFEVSHVTNARVGVAAGLCLSDPDIWSFDRISRHPSVHQITELGRAGVVVDHNVHTVWNSQNTAFIRDLAPAMFLYPGVGRMDDIYASLICKKIMQKRNLYAHFGQPLVAQQRNQHDLVKDLRQEINGIDGVKKLADMLDGVELHETSNVIDHMRYICDGFARHVIPSEFIRAALAFLDDCEQVMG